MPDGATSGAAQRLLAQAAALVAQGRAAEAMPCLMRLRGAEAAPALMAQAQLALRRYPDAVAAASEVLFHQPSDGALLALRAQARAAMGEAEGALDDAAAAVMAAPGDLAANALLGDLLAQAEQLEDALLLHRRVLAAQPEDMPAQLRLARTLMLAGEHAEAEALLAAAEARAPTMPGVVSLRAQNLLLGKDLAGAEAVARAGLARGVAEAPVQSMLAHVLVAQGRLADAAPHFRAAARLLPQDAYLAHLAAATNGEATDRAGAAYVANLFDGYAARFDDALMGLGYRVPGLVRRAAEEWLAEQGLAEIPGPVLDLGCGTGLAGVALLGLTPAGLHGMDLSGRMLAQAREKGLYASLQQADIVAALEADGRRYALIVAADVFCYLGDLSAVLRLCASRLALGGVLLFSVEQGAEATPWQLGPSGRYGHARGYLDAVLAAAGLAVQAFTPEPLRRDGATVVQGFFVRAEVGGRGHA